MPVAVKDDSARFSVLKIASDVQEVPGPRITNLSQRCKDFVRRNSIKARHSFYVRER